jgi:hypothetical protein
MLPSQRLVSFVGEYQKRGPEIFKEHTELFAKDIPLHPIPFFGPLETARILTVALNPANTEFSEWRWWPSQMPAKRLAGRLFNYFKLPFPPPHPWFGKLQEAMSIIHCSYQWNAAHIDISGWATEGLRGKSSQWKSDYQNLLKDDAQFLSELVRIPYCLKLVIILCAGVERSRAITAIKMSYPGRIETVPKAELVAWAWSNRKEIIPLVHC